MILETVIFTALPTGRKGNEVTFSVLISPQLGGEEGSPKPLPLSRYGDFANGAWAEIVRSIEWQLALRWSRDDADEQYFEAVRVSADPDPALLRAMFPSDMNVVPYVFDRPGDATLLSYPAARLADALDVVQETVAEQDPEDRPTNYWLVSSGKDGVFAQAPLDGFVLTPERRAQMNAKIDAQLDGDGVTKAPSTNTANDTALMVTMLRRILSPTATAEEMTTPVSWPDLDFHQVLSLLGAHPNLLRRLGFLVDLRASIAGVRRKDESVRVYPMSSWPGVYDPAKTGVDITTAYPRVMSTLRADYFRPKPRTRQLTAAGFIDLRGARAITSNIESEVLATEAEATSLARMSVQDRASFGTPDRSATPARHSGGVEIVRPDFAYDYLKVLQAMVPAHDALATGDDIFFDAEDVQIGHRVDVRRKGQAQWRSLHRRRGILTPFAGANPLAVVDLGEDEGWAEVAATSALSDVVGGRPTLMRLRESLALWSGWSLSIPQPGQSLDADDAPASRPTAAGAPEFIESMHGAIDYTAPADGARLPTLRFSKTPYEVRMRWVDAGGNSLDPGAPGGSILEVPYLRHDPVPSPDIYLAAEPVWGESVDVAVIRSSESPTLRRAGTSRYVAPPRASASLAIAHGMFDDPDGRPKRDAYTTIADKESAQFSQYDGEVMTADPRRAPYLVDPLAQGLFVRGVPTNGVDFDGEILRAYGGAWPALNTLTIVVDGTRPPGASIVNGSIVVGLAPGRVAHLRISNSLSNEGLELLDLWRRAGKAAQADRARKGAWWQLTPDRVLVVVHAIQRPVAAPRFVAEPKQRRWAGGRRLNDSAATLAGRLLVDQPSTESVDLVGTRTYAIDDGPGTEAPVVVIDADMGVVGTVDVADPGPGGGAREVGGSVRAAFPDTRSEIVSLTAVAKSRFAEYFRQFRDVTASTNPIVLNGGKPVVEGSLRVTYPAGVGTVTAPPAAYLLDAATGTFTVSDEAAAADRIPLGRPLRIGFIPGPITRSSTERGGTPLTATATMTVPSSARPLPPAAEWILPAFAWSASGGAQRASSRSGGLLRIYLARPWFTSGLGERLAIVLRPGTPGANDSRDELVTRWGLDPITRSGTLPTGGYAGFPRPDDFVGGVEVPRVRLAEVDADVDLVTFAVGTHNARGVVSGFDAERDMYYVDLEMRMGSAYRPFVRLALARYQPNSVDGLELSPVSMVDVVQLEPDRSATVSMVNDARQATKAVANVTLTGRSYVENEVGPGPGKAVVILERYDGPVPPKGSPVRIDTSRSAAWTEVSRATMTPVMRTDGRDAGMVTWSGRLTVDRVRAEGKFRIVIEECEVIRTDGEAGRLPASGAAREAALGQRLVHQDIIGI